MSQSSKHWIIKEETQIQDLKPLFQVVKRRCISATDPTHQHDFYVLKSRDWCNIIPVTEDGHVVMIRQWRAGVDEQTLEIPGGIVDGHTDGSEEQALEAALREMIEETGFTPLPGARCLHIGSGQGNPAILDNLCHSYVVGPVSLTQEQNLDSSEMIEVLAVPLDQVPDLIKHGHIQHPHMLNAFLFLLLKSPQGSQALIQELSQAAEIK